MHEGANGGTGGRQTHQRMEGGNLVQWLPRELEKSINLGMFIDFHGFSWMLMDFHGFSWIFMDLVLDVSWFSLLFGNFFEFLVRFRAL